MNIEELKERLPKPAMITSVGFEGAEVVIYTKSKKFFVEGAEDIKPLVMEIHKRIDLRPDSSICMDEETARKKIMEIVPKEAGIGQIVFEPEFSKVIVYA